MDQSDAVAILKEALSGLLTVASPILISAIVIGLCVSIIQAATQINEQSLGFVLKILAIFIALIVFGPWMITRLIDFASMIFDYMAHMV